MFIDAHIHIGLCPKKLIRKNKNHFFSVANILNHLDKNNIDKGLIFPFPNKNLEENNKNNEYLAKAIKNNQNLYGLLFFSGSENIIFQKNIIGIKIHPTFSNKNVGDIVRFLPKEKLKQKIILFDSSVGNIGHPKYIIKFAKKNKEIFVIIAHMARLYHKELLEIAKLKNIFIDVSGMSLLSKNIQRLAPCNFRHPLVNDKNISVKNILDYLISYLGTNKILWGSDYPFYNFFNGDIKQEITIIKNSNKKIIGANFIKLIGLIKN
jgi:hypothetical protein